MDFFARQDLARRNTRLLVVLFSLAIVALILLANLLLGGFFWLSEDGRGYLGGSGGLSGLADQLSWERFGWVSLLVLGSVGLVSLVTWISLASGGKHIAESLGGTRVLPQTDDADERRCLNIVEEIALAAGMPVPDLYVLHHERGINAFAAGVGPADAVVAVTAGTLHHLKRDELQGVIAHEFSHILNGDMRLNIRLAALLKGITFLGDVGYFFLRSGAHGQFRSGRGRQQNNGLPLLGVGLVAVGWIGGLAAGMIKSAISRQKEFLADASAVQFTRNPEGIGSALKVIGGYLPGTLVHAARAPEMSHLFFGSVTHRLFQPFSTHPPLATRIRRIDPAWDGEYIKRQVRHYANTPLRRDSVDRSEDPALVLAAALATGVLREPTVDEPAEAAGTPAGLEAPAGLPGPAAAIPVALMRHAHEPLGASAITLAFLLAGEEDTRRHQLDLVEAHGVAGLATLANTLAPAIANLPAGARLPLVNTCLPALRAMSPPQYRAFKQTLLQLIQADGRTSLFEWCIYQLVRHYLDPEFLQVRTATPRFRRMTQVESQLQRVLSMLAHAGSGVAGDAFASARNSLEMPSLQLLPIADCSLAEFSRSVHELADCYPLLKPRLLKAMEQAAGADGEVCAVERELIAAIAAVIDCPLPPSLQSALPS
ncbi:MAG: M48 family metallopeptidase [Chromatocurvus sp.]